MKTVILKTRSKPQNTHPKTPSPYDPQHPYKEPQSSPKDITCKDIEKDLIENDPSKGSQTDMDTEKGDEAENDSFETIAPERTIKSRGIRNCAASQPGASGR